MKFRSLMFREFKLLRKNILLYFALLLLMMALVWGLLLTDENLMVEINAAIIATALVGSMSLLMDENFKADINSGWLGYSYALPITPLQRTAANFIRKYSVCIGGVLMSLCNAGALCLFMGKQFSVNYIVWHIVALASAILTSLTNDLFILRARNAADMKKMQTVSGLANTMMMVVLIIIFWKVSGVGFDDLGGGESAVRLPEFTAGTLVWAVPLLIAMMSASFFAEYFSLRSAYSNARKSEKDNIVGKTQAVIPSKSSGATGLLYKELKQNRLVLILTAVTPILLTAFPFCFSAIELMLGNTTVDEMFKLSTDLIMRMLMFVIGIFIVSGLMDEVFKGDDKKLWACFVVSTPQGVKGFIYRKYVITLMVNLVYMASNMFADNLLATVNYFVTGKELTTSMSSVYMSGVFLLLMISAFDIPFTVRYGSKKGSVVKMIMMLSLCAAGIAGFELLPSEIASKIAVTVMSVFDGEPNDVLMLIQSIFPYIAFAAFLCSYQVACKVFMKGVNEFDK